MKKYRSIPTYVVPALTAILLLIALHAQGQSKQRVKVIHAIELILLQGDSANFQKLHGKVELKHEDAFMYCDTAIIENETHVVAQGNIVIQQGDSLEIFADSLIYDGLTRIAFLNGNVVLVNAGQELFTDELEYDLNTKIARYFTGASLVSDSLQLTSRKGFYYAKAREAFFSDSVVVTDPKFSLIADSLLYQVPDKRVVFQGPTVLTTDSSRIYCEQGFYNTATEQAVFSVNAQYQKGSQQAVADSIFFDNLQQVYELKGNAVVEDSARYANASYIRYDEKKEEAFLSGNARYKSGDQDIQSEEITYNEKSKTYSTKGRSTVSEPPQLLMADSLQFDDASGLGHASGNVIWQDTAAENTILCGQADYNKEQDFFKAFDGIPGRPELISVLDQDSLFLSADTLVSFRPLPSDSLQQDTARRILSYGQVRMYKENFQATCDSMLYHDGDSLFVLMGNPVIWSDTSQFVADTIYVYLKDRRIHQIYLKQNAFILVVSDGIYFNQIKGRDILAHFMEEELERMDASGNAEVIYYAKDAEDAYVGVNQTACSDMVIRMKSNEVKRITFLSTPTSTLMPMGKAEHNTLRLKGFQYIEEGRPLKREDIFVKSND